MSDVQIENSMMAIKEYLNTSEQPLSTAEFAEFWKSLSEEEREEYKRTELK